ncbi:hypothetical protein GGH99_003280 [Coemansia sp. RSA 1285]|nr:hypothetical protein EV177_000576 [Coemansia sp. RSA 1804]KAJ2687334.1 hypothetical protein GGH99_003280 [Coemansia sp. RSA 1285]
MQSTSSASSIDEIENDEHSRGSSSNRSSSNRSSSNWSSSRMSSTMVELDAPSIPLPALPTNCGNGYRNSDDYICAQLDQMRRRRLNSQCAQLRLPRQQQEQPKPPQQPKQMDLGEILYRAGKLTANRMINQDFTPQRLRNMESMHQIADDTDSLSSSFSSASLDDDGHCQQRIDISSHRMREIFLENIAARLRRTDGVDSANSFESQRAAHPREHMRSFLLKAVDKLKHMDDPVMDRWQRFHVPQHQQQTVSAAAPKSVPSHHSS